LRAGFSAWTNKRASSPSEFPLPADRWFFLLNNIEGYEAAAEDKTALLTIIPASYEYILTANSWIAQTVTCVFHRQRRRVDEPVVHASPPLFIQVPFPRWHPLHYFRLDPELAKWHHIHIHIRS
jgi:hypothetical protein